MIVRALDAAGKPVANLPINWSITQGKGTISPTSDPALPPHDQTDANGYASTYFVATAVDPGYSFQTATITASSSQGNANFILTYNISRTQAGSSVDLPLVQVNAPTTATLRGRSGDTLPAAIVIQTVEQSGPQQGQPVPNASLRIVDYDNPDNPNPAAACAAPTLTDASGIAKCDLVITAAPGTYGIAAEVGEYRKMALIVLTVDPGAPCTYSLSPGSQSFTATGGPGTVSVTSGAGCAWTASANATWINITSAANGTANGSVSYSVAPNQGPQRSGALTIGGQSFTITQAGVGGPGSLAVSTTSLPAAVVNTPYSATISATGGKSPYSFAASSLPAGFTLNPNTGAITGSSGVTGAYTFKVTVTDAAGATATQNLTLSVGTTPSGTNPVITSTFPAGNVGIAYSQVLNSSGGCNNPFSVTRFELAGGTLLPDGLSITNTDHYYVSGTPTTPGTFNFSVKVTDPCGNSSTSNFSIIIGTNPSGGSLTASPTAIQFSMQPGGALPLDQTFSVTTTGSSGVSYTATASTTSGGNWLIISNGATGTAPATVTLHIDNATSLAAGAYNGTVSITSNAGTASVTVTLSVSPNGATIINANPMQLDFTIQGQSSSMKPQQTVAITSSAAPIHFKISTRLPTGGNWLTVSPGEADTPAALTVGVDATGLRPDTYYAYVIVTPSAGGGAAVNILVTLHVNPAPVLTLSAGNLAFVSQGAGNPANQMLNVSSSSGATNIVATAATQGGGNWLSVTPTSGQTPAGLTVAANTAGLSPGSYQGIITVGSPVQGVVPVTVSVSLTIPQNAPSVLAVVNAGSFLPGAISPGEILVITGSAMGPKDIVPMSVTNGSLDRTLSGAKVFFDGIDAPLVYVSGAQLAAIVPYEIAGRAVTRLVVQYQGVQSAPITLNVADAAPGLFMVAAGQAAALNQDGSVNAQNNPAAPGSIVVLYATGEGVTNPPANTGELSNMPFDQLPRPKSRVAVTIGGKDATIVYSGAAPGLTAGVMQVNAVIPADLGTGPAIPVMLTVGNATSQPALIYVSQ
jgi:uncharacterized protein (TIGR03437 family)